MFSQLLRKIAMNPNDTETWRKLLTFQRRLVIPPEFRRKTRSQRDQQLREYIIGKIATLNSEQLQAPPIKDDNVLRRCARQRIDAGQSSSAIQLVLDEGKAIRPDAETLEALRKKHPIANGDQVIAEPPCAPPIILDREAVKHAILSLSWASAPGPDRLRPSHFKQFLSVVAGPSRENVLDSMSEFASVCASGSIPIVIAPFFFSATLCALRYERRTDE